MTRLPIVLLLLVVPYSVFAFTLDAPEGPKRSMYYDVATGRGSVIAVGRIYVNTGYLGLIDIFSEKGGALDLKNRTFFDFAQAGLENFCTAVVPVEDKFVASCRSMESTTFWDIYLVKFDQNGFPDPSFGKNGILKTGIGGNSNSGHALPRGIAYSAQADGLLSYIAVVGGVGKYTGVFHPFIALFDQKTGSQVHEIKESAINGTAVGVRWDELHSSYYMASTESAAPHKFHVHRYAASLETFGGAWGKPVDFLPAGGGVDSVPETVTLLGENVIVSGINRVDENSYPSRCAVVALNRKTGNLDRNFGENTLFGATPGNQKKGISLFSHQKNSSETRDCILRGSVSSTAHSILVGTGYNGSNYDVLSAKMDASGAVSNLLLSSKGTSDDVAYKVAFSSTSSDYYAVGRKLDIESLNHAMVWRFSPNAFFSSFF